MPGYIPVGCQIKVAVVWDMSQFRIKKTFLPILQRDLRGVVVEASASDEAPLRRELQVPRHLPGHAQIMPPRRIGRAAKTETAKRARTVVTCCAPIRGGGIVLQPAAVQARGDRAPTSGQELPIVRLHIYPGNQCSASVEGPRHGVTATGNAGSKQSARGRAYNLAAPCWI